MKTTTITTYEIELTKEESHNFYETYMVEWRKENGNQTVLDLGRLYFHDYYNGFDRPITKDEYELLKQLVK